MRSSPSPVSPLPAMRRMLSAVSVAAAAPVMRAVRPAAASRPLHTLRSAACAQSAPASSAAAASFSTHAGAGASAATPAPLVAPAFGTQSHTDARFMYLKGVKADGRSKRFYAKVGVVPVQTSRGAEFALQLDGRYVVTPHDHVISCPTRAAAMAIAFEWDSQGDFIRPISMPMTNICVTALDQAFDNRAKFIKHFGGAMQTDSVFLRTTGPSGLVQQHRRQWDPLLTWMRDRYNCDLKTTLEIETPAQSEEARASQMRLLESLSGWQLAALDALTTVTKSFIISWALLAERLTVSQAFEAARLEENFQMRQYGKVEGVYGHGIDMEFTRMSIAAAKTFNNLVSPLEPEPMLQTHKKE